MCKSVHLSHLVSVHWLVSFAAASRQWAAELTLNGQTARLISRSLYPQSETVKRP